MKTTAHRRLALLTGLSLLALIVFATGIPAAQAKTDGTGAGRAPPLSRGLPSRKARLLCGVAPPAAEPCPDVSATVSGRIRASSGNAGSSPAWPRPRSSSSPRGSCCAAAGGPADAPRQPTAHSTPKTRSARRPEQKQITAACRAAGQRLRHPAEELGTESAPPRLREAPPGGSRGRGAAGCASRWRCRVTPAAHGLGVVLQLASVFQAVVRLAQRRPLHSAPSASESQTAARRSSVAWALLMPRASAW